MTIIEYTLIAMAVATVGLRCYFMLSPLPKGDASPELAYPDLLV